MKTILHKIFVLTLLIGIFTQTTTAKPTIEDFNKNYYTQICKKLISCQASYRVAETLMMMQVKDTDDCVEKLSSRDSAKQWKDSLDNKQITFNAQNIPVCLTAISKLTCETIAKRVFKPSGIKGCEKIIEGKVLDFKKCTSHLECSNAQAACYDTCQPPRALECGEELCNASQYCDTVKNKCFAPKPVGEKCLNFSQCQTLNCTDGICKELPDVRKAGAPCGKELSNICAMGHWCSDDLHKCIPFDK